MEENKKIISKADYNDNVTITCPLCGHEIIKNIVTDMPWGEDDSLPIKCEKCELEFEIYPEYKFVEFKTKLNRYGNTTFYDEDLTEIDESLQLKELKLTEVKNDRRIK